MSDLLLTRRQTLQSFAFSAVFGGSLFGLVGCGGGGHGGGGGAKVHPQSTHVPVSLPSGFSIPPAELEGGTVFGTAPLDATGFVAKINVNAPTFAYVRHKTTGKYVLFGLVGNGRPGVTPLASAALSMALALGITGLPGANVAEALTLLEADPNVMGLRDAIASAMATDPYALTNDNASVASALKTAFQGLTGAASPNAVPQIARRDASAPLVLVNPPNDQGGFRLDQPDDGAITPTNLKRRPAFAYTYLVGHTSDGGSTTPVSPAQRIDLQELGGTTTLVGSLASLGAQGAYAPVAGKSVDVPVSSGDTKTSYQTIVLLASGDNGSEPTFFGSASFANEVAEWRQKRQELNVAAFMGTMADIFGCLAAGVAKLTVAAANTIANDMAAAATAAGEANFLAEIQSGNFGNFAKWALESIARGELPNANVLADIEEVLQLAPAGPATVEGLSIIGVAAFALTVFATLTIALSLADLSASYLDYLSSPQAVLWDVSAVKPGVHISPRKADVRQGQSFTLSATVAGAEGTGTVYTWTLSGGIGCTLRDDSTGQAGSSIQTSSSTVVLSTTASTQGTLTVAVSAKSAAGKDLGSDKGSYTMVENKPVTETGTYFTDSQAYPDGSGGVYQFGVKFADVPGATYYNVHGEGPNDPVYYGTSFDKTYVVSNPPIGYFGAVDHEILLGGGSGGNLDGSIAADAARFTGWKYTVTAYFANY